MIPRMPSALQYRVRIELHRNKKEENRKKEDYERKNWRSLKEKQPEIPPRVEKDSSIGKNERENAPKFGLKNGTAVSKKRETKKYRRKNNPTESGQSLSARPHLFFHIDPREEFRKKTFRKFPFLNRRKRFSKKQFSCFHTQKIDSLFYYGEDTKKGAYFERKAFFKR